MNHGQAPARRHDRFSRFSTWVAHHAGRPGTFLLAVVIVLVWAVSGPVFGFSDFWQLTINTGTTIITFLMVFLLQNTQARDTAALQLKLDELIRANRAARNAMLDLEELSEEELAQVHAEYAALAQKA